jgi:hypothetical protein
MPPPNNTCSSGTIFWNTVYSVFRTNSRITTRIHRMARYDSTDGVCALFAFILTVKSIVDLFKDPKEPSSKTKSLTLHSLDGKPLPSSKRLTRRVLKDSFATIASFESATRPSFPRTQPQSSTDQNVKGLIIQFHDASGMYITLPFFSRLYLPCHHVICRTMVKSDSPS